MANSFSAIAAAHLANSWQCCLVANAFSAAAAACLAYSWQRCSVANGFSAVTAARLANSWWCYSEINAFSAIAAVHWLTLGGIVPQPTQPASAARQPCWPKPLLALQLPVDAAPLQALHASSSPACIANKQEWPCVAVAAKSGGQAGRGGGGSKATGKWFGLPPSVMQEQCVWP